MTHVTFGDIFCENLKHGRETNFARTGLHGVISALEARHARGFSKGAYHGGKVRPRRLQMPGIRR